MLRMRSRSPMSTTTASKLLHFHQPQIFSGNGRRRKHGHHHLHIFSLHPSFFHNYYYSSSSSSFVISNVRGAATRPLALSFSQSHHHHRNQQSSHSFSSSASPTDEQEPSPDEDDEFDFDGGGDLLVDDDFDLDGEEEFTDEWDEEEQSPVEVGDGGAGGGIVLNSLPWGELVLSIARDVLKELAEDISIFSFKTTTKGYVYVRLDKLSNKSGCPSFEEIESFTKLYRQRLEEAGKENHIPDDLALEVSSPGLDRIVRVPEDLNRFKDRPLQVSYLNTGSMPNNSKGPKDGIFVLESIEEELGQCTLKLANVKANREVLGKGRPQLSRKQKEWKLTLPFEMIKKVTFYVE